MASGKKRADKRKVKTKFGQTGVKVRFVGGGQGAIGLARKRTVTRVT